MMQLCRKERTRTPFGGRAGAMTDVIAGVVIVHFGDPELTLRCLESVMGEGNQM